MKSFAQRLNGTLMFLARMVAKSNVTLAIGGRRAYFNGDKKHIQLPSMPDTDEMAKDLAIGMVLHEAGHAAYSDTSFYAALPSKSYLRDMLNIIDDVQEERQVTRDWPGAAQALKATVERLCETGMFASADPSDRAGVIQTYVLMHLRHVVLGQPCGNLAQDARQSFIAHWGSIKEDAFRNMLESEMNLVWSTEAALAMAKKVIAFFASDQQDDDTGSGSSSDKDGDDDDTGSGSSSDQDGDDGSDAARKLDPFEGDSGSDRDFDLGSILSKELEARCRNQSYEPSRVEMPESKDLTEDAGINELSETLVHSHALRGRLVNLIESSRKVPSSRGVHGNRFDRNKVWRYRLGDDKLRVRKHKKPDVNTAVWLLLDVSGSMGDKIHLARQSLLAACLALESIDGTRVGAACFPHLIDGDDDHFPSGVGVILRPGESTRRNASRFMLSADGGTPLAGALWWCGSQLLAMPEPRRMLFVFTDGEPDETETSQYALNVIDSVGVETYGMAIGSAARRPVQELFKRNATVTDMRDLQKGMFDMLKSAYLLA